MLTVLAVSLLLTLLFEELFALAWGLRGKRELGLVALVNVLTNPPVVLLYHTATALWESRRGDGDSGDGGGACGVAVLPGVLGTGEAALPVCPAGQSVFLRRGVRRQSAIGRI